MNYIKLTKNKKQHLVNMDLVEYITPNGRGGSDIYFECGSIGRIISVKESIDDIYKMIDNSPYGDEEMVVIGGRPVPKNWEIDFGDGKGNFGLDKGGLK